MRYPSMMILALNAGSSSLKFAVFAAGANDRLLSGALSRIGTSEGTLIVHGTPAEERRLDLPDHAAAWRALTETLGARLDVHQFLAVGHRVVHGGPTYTGPVRITAQVEDTLRALIPLAPEHLPQALDAIDAVRRWSPTVPQIACFDTAFHRRMPPVAQLWGLTRALAELGLIRYGFHGLSYEYIVGAVPLGKRAIIAHLGNGASVAAVLDGRSIDTSMGMTPIGGLVMGTRPGDLDPGVVLYLLNECAMSADAVSRLVNHQAGLLGLSGLTGDMQELLASSDANARQAVDVFCYHVTKTIGAYAAALGGVDTIVFTGGIGEHAAFVRHRITAGLEFLGVRLDAERNQQHADIISETGATVTVRVVATDEELMIAKHVTDLLRDQPPASA
jgi:acetate kinase